MIKFISAIVFLSFMGLQGLPLALAGELAKKSEGSVDLIGKEVSGVVRVIRARPETEVFFKDLKDSVIIPKDSHHNEIFEACTKSQKTGEPVSLVIDPKSHRVLSLKTGTSLVPAGAAPVN